MAAPVEDWEVQAPETADSRAAARALVDAVRLGAVAFGRPDLADVLAGALARIDRATTIVAVVGDYKQGKSALVNALLGEAVAVVADDVATAVPTLFRYGDAWTATATTPGNDAQAEDATRRLTLDEYRVVASGAQAREQPAVEPSAAAVDVTLPSPVLADGLALLDTPSAGGFSTRGAGLFGGLLRSVDGVIYVADVSAPLDRPRLELLKRVLTVCPAVLVVRTKTDLYGEWRRVLDIDAAALSAAALDVPVVAVSSALMGYAALTSDAAIAEQSGIPALRRLLASVVMGETRRDAVERAVDDAAFVLDQLIEVARDELRTLDDPSSAAARGAALEESRARLAHLRGPGARWSQVLSDTFGDAVGDADHVFRSTMREIAREVDERLEQIDPAREWPAFAAWLQERAAAASDQLLAGVTAAAAAAEQAAREVLREETDPALAGVLDVPAVAVDAGRLASAKGVDAPGVRGSAGLVFSALRGGQSGFFSLSFIAGIAGITLSGVAAAGLGLVFAGRQVLDDRRRQLQARRQGARTAARRYLDDVEFVTSKQSRDAARDRSRALREHFLDQFARVQQTCAESVATMESAINMSEAQRSRRAAVLRDRLAQLDQLRAAATALQEANG